MSEPTTDRSTELTPGSRLGPYEILSLLGAGGMGEVYRARDTRLAREVALKVLAQAGDEDSGLFRRFQTEAKATAALSHPNIVVVHDVGQENGTAYIISELVPGGTLTSLLERGPLPVKKLLDLAIPIADALAAAHANGIVHRDLKPDNILLSADGTPKIADFGLAKYLAPIPMEGTLGTTLPDDRTREGMIVGTVGYMSPEQAQGKPLDFQSDQFSLGSVLYELATSTRAFRRKSVVETLAAIINEEPEPIGAVNAQIPPPLRWIIERCLAKDPQGRYASTSDLARELAKLREHLSETAHEIRGAAERRPKRSLAWLMLAAALVATGMVVARVSSKPPPLPLPSFQQLTFRRGSLLRARYTPEGGSLIYSAAWEGAPLEIFTARLDGTESRPFGIKNADVLAVSSRGEVAVQLRSTNLLNPNGTGTLAVVPLAGGAPRELLENVFAADWGRNGTDLAVVRREAGGSRLELPIGRVLYATTNIIDNPRVSGSGQRIAFVEANLAGEELRIVDSSGAPKTLLNIGAADVINGLVWGPGDREIIFGRFVGSPSGNTSNIDAVDLAGRVRHLYRGAVLLVVNDLLPDGRLLVEQAKESAELMVGSQQESTDRNLAWRTNSWFNDLSEDGHTLLFQDHSNVYLRKTDGSPAIRLGAGTHGTLSPDGRVALVTSESTHDISILPTGPGEPRTIAMGNLVVDYSLLLADGKSIVLGAMAGDGKTRLYITDRSGATPRPISEPETSLSWALSADEREIALANAAGKLAIYNLSSGSARAVPSLAPDENIVAWTGDGKALFVFRPGELPLRIDRFDLATGRKELWKTIAPPDMAGVYQLGPVGVTRNGNFWAYSVMRSSSDELWQMTGLK